MNSAVGVFVEHLKGKIIDITYEMLGIGRKIADKFNVPLYAILVGNNISNLSSLLGIANTVFITDEQQLELASSKTIAGILKNILDDKKISLFFIGGTNASTEIGTRLAARFELPFINFCKNIQIVDKTIIFTSQMYGGKILADVTLPDNTGVVSIYPGSFPSDAGKNEYTTSVEVLKIPVEASEVTFKGYIEPKSEDVDITKQDILVSIGRGIQNQENIQLAEELATVLGGVISGSRPVIDQGWLPLTRLVGKSGMSVKPKLYLALGISGAPEHLEGMKNSQMIIAINTDPKAPIYDVAKYGICSDLFDIVPALIDKIRLRR